jgi:ABC-type transport system involved in multi-copper enzyme maturation permease subunit
MNLLPVIVRELRAQSRQPMTYWLRVVGIGAIVGVLALLDLRGAPSELGGRLFSALNATLFLSIWIFVPLLTADTISREKREGTLGLLFLTPLTPLGIVLGKSLIHSLRAATLFLAALPALAMPFLLGGLTWKDCAVSLLLNGSALVLALAAGLLASTLATDSRRALALALALSLGFAYLFMLAHFRCFYSTLPGFINSLPFGQRTIAVHWSFRENVISQILTLISFNTGFGFGGYPNYNWWGRMTPAEGWRFVWLNYPVAFHGAWIRALGWLFIKSIIGFAAIAVLASWRVRQSWRLEPPSLRQAQIQRIFCAPRIWKSVFRSKMSGLLSRNPVGWLQQYSWRARLVKWGWCLGVVLLECVLVTDHSLSNLWDGQYLLAALLILGVAFTASGSFREERQTGAMELLLITPMTVPQILRGRIQGVWGQFLPATVALALAWLWLLKDAALFAGHDYASHAIYWQVFSLVLPLFFISSFFLLPCIGLFFSMQRLHFVGAWLLTCLTGLLVPALSCWWMKRSWLVAVLILFTTQLVLALISRILLGRNLNRRLFALGAA